jgi:hypothetical protein
MDRVSAFLSLIALAKNEAKMENEGECQLAYV